MEESKETREFIAKGELINHEDRDQKEKNNESEERYSTSGYREDLESLCGSLMELAFGAWSILSGKNRELTETEQRLLGQRLAAVVVKHDMQKYVKEELFFFGALGVVVYRKMRQDKEKDRDSKDNG